ncbi:MAG: cytochrome c [Thiotrichaceae bacterium]|nr:cytochrome c [Thiotrichaceae bacterium]
MKQKLSIAFFVILVAVSQFLSVASAGDKKPLVLRKIMQDMGENMQSITDGISREDWELVKSRARLIAEHPKPPFGEKLRILSFVGTDTRKFKKLDEKTHDAAVILEQAATEQDGAAVIQSFFHLQNSCLECHQKFRKPFLQKFYDQNP